MNKLNPAGTVIFRAPQMQWDDCGVYLQKANFAGQIMYAAGNDELDEFVLWYLNFESKSYATMEDAKAAAKEFALEVLDSMKELISEPDRIYHLMVKDEDKQPIWFDESHELFKDDGVAQARSRYRKIFNEDGKS